MPGGVRVNGSWGDGFGPIQDLKQYGDEYGWTLFHSGEQWEYREGHNRDLMPDELCAQDAVCFLKEKHAKPFILQLVLLPAFSLVCAKEFLIGSP